MLIGQPVDVCAWRDCAAVATTVWVLQRLLSYGRPLEKWTPSAFLITRQLGVTYNAINDQCRVRITHSIVIVQTVVEITRSLLLNNLPTAFLHDVSAIGNQGLQAALRVAA